jgi:MoaA/NifB/PqqE/SkfB family radical SAM enzyme
MNKTVDGNQNGQHRDFLDDRTDTVAHTRHFYRPEWTCGRYNQKKHCALMYNLILGVVNYFDELSADVIGYILSVPRKGEILVDAIMEKTKLPSDVVLGFMDQLQNAGLVTTAIPGKYEINEYRRKVGEWRRSQRLTEKRSTQEKLPYEISNAEMQYNKAAGEEASVTSVMFELTYNCSEKCIHCYNPGATRNDSEKSGRALREELNLDDYKKLIDELYELGLYKVCLSGGDPFSKPIVWDIIDYLWRKEIAFDIFTNGQRVFDDVERLLSYYPRLIGVSIYSRVDEVHDKITRVPGSLRKSVKFMERLSEYGMAMNLKCVIMQPNLKTYTTVKSLAAECGAVPQFEVCVDPSNEGDMCAPKNLRLNEKQLDVVLRDDDIPLYVGPEAPGYGGQSRLMDVNACGAGDTSFSITPEGNVQVCCAFPASLGNVKENSMAEILAGEQLHKWQKTTLEAYEECGKHDYCGYCNLCPGNNFVENGSPLKASESNCFFARTRFSLARRMMDGYDPLDGKSLDDAIAGLETVHEPLAKQETRNFRNRKFEVE